MSPRGVATPGTRERLIHAAERVLLRDGPEAMTARAITREAGCATGVLYLHFPDLDEFLTEVVAQRFQRAADDIGTLVERAGSATVTGNLVDAACRLLDPPVYAAVRLAQSRDAVQARLRARRSRQSPTLGRFEEAFAGYLEAEQRLGRVTASADPGAAAMLLFGVLFHLMMHYLPLAAEPDQVTRRELVRRVVAGLETGLAP